MASIDEDLCPINPHPCPFGPKIDEVYKEIKSIRASIEYMTRAQENDRKKLWGNGEEGYLIKMSQKVAMNSATCRAGIKIVWLLLGVGITGGFATLAGVVIWAISKGALA